MPKQISEAEMRNKLTAEFLVSWEKLNLPVSVDGAAALEVWVLGFGVVVFGFLRCRLLSFDNFGLILALYLLSCFRVEFQYKFYTGGGYKFTPFSFQHLSLHFNKDDIA